MLHNTVRGIFVVELAMIGEKSSYDGKKRLKEGKIVFLCKFYAEIFGGLK